MKIGFAGFYQLEKRKVLGETGDGELILGPAVVVAPWFSNHITNAGLDSQAGTQQADQLTYCRLGTGNSTPADGDTSLGAQVAASNTVGTGSASGWSTGNTYAYRRVARRFGAGSASGVNLAEVGMSATANGPLFSRALLSDMDGEPITITLESDEILDVLYELRGYCDLSTVTGNFVINGVSTEVTCRAIGWGSSPAFNPDTLGRTVVRNMATSNVNQNALAIATAGLNTTVPGPNSPANSGIITAAAYVPGSFTRTFTCAMGLSDGNIAGGIGGFQFGQRNYVSYGFGESGFGAWALTFSPPITKNNTMTGTVTYGMSWGRHTP